MAQATRIEDVVAAVTEAEAAAPVYQFPPVFTPIKSEADIELMVQNILPPVVHNVVAVAYDDSHEGVIKLDQIAWLCRGKQNRREFAAPCTLVQRFAGHKYTLNIFEQRRFVVTGAANEAVARLGITMSFDYIYRRTDLRFRVDRFRVTNIQATVYMPGALNIALIHETLPTSLYRPDRINMVTFSMKDPKITFLLFPSGAVVMTGAKTREELCAAFVIAIPFFAHFVSSTPADRDIKAHVDRIVKCILKRVEPHWLPLPLPALTAA